MSDHVPDDIERDLERDLDSVRLHKALAAAGVSSRRAAERMISAGRVAVNGSTAIIGQRVVPARDVITVDGQPVGQRPPLVYLALHKPAGVTSTTRGRAGETTVLDLVSDESIRRHGRIYPVGRLDRDSEGLILLTNDGQWADRLLHPRYQVEREYSVGLATPMTSLQVRSILAGVELEEGIAHVRSLRLATSAEGRLLGRSVDGVASFVWYRVVLTQGWKRQIRRTLAAVGVPVGRLVRVRIGGLRLADMASGEVRPLGARERSALLEGSSETSQGLVVSLDGPASSGKSTVGAGAASELGYRFCDTGVLYRALTWLALERRADTGQEAVLVQMIPELDLVADDAGRLRHVRVAGTDVTAQLHSPAVDDQVSRVSQHPGVRAAFLPVQRALAVGGRIIMAGRDIGTVVLPNADLKLYIDVSLDERAARRAADRGLPPASEQARDLLADLRRRDGLDSTRDVAPLRVPPDALIIRSEGNTLAQTVASVVRAIRARETEPAS